MSVKKLLYFFKSDYKVREILFCVNKFAFIPFGFLVEQDLYCYA